MLMRFLAAAAVLSLAAPATAATFDAASSFNATQGTAGFTYGSFDGLGFTAFDSNSNCVIGGIICLRSSSVSLPTVLTGPAVSGALIVHPGEFNDSVYVAWTATANQTYSYTAQFTQADTSANVPPHSVGITEFYTPVGGTTQFFTRVIVDGATPSILTGFTTPLNTGDTIGYIVDKDGVYFNDSTGVEFTVTGSIPEPSTWLMMVAGFGLIGAGLRRRNALAA